MARVVAVARVVERGGKIFLALAPESFLGGFEICHARGDLFALARTAVLLLSHAHPLSNRVPCAFAWQIGARIGIRRCRIVICCMGDATSRWIKAAALLVAGAPSR